MAQNIVEGRWWTPKRPAPWKTTRLNSHSKLNNRAHCVPAGTLSQSPLIRQRGPLRPRYLTPATASDQVRKKPPRCCGKFWCWHLGLDFKLAVNFVSRAHNMFVCFHGKCSLLSVEIRVKVCEKFLVRVSASGMNFPKDIIGTLWAGTRCWEGG